MFSKVLECVVEQFPQYKKSGTVQLLDAQIHYNSALRDALTRIGDRVDEANALRAFDANIRKQQAGMSNKHFQLEVCLLEKAIKVFNSIEGIIDWTYR